MTTDLALAQPAQNLAEQMDYARAVSSGALLPQAYRGKPADILLAIGLGQAMGLSPAESLYRIDVIQGKPTASAELIAANVRKAGHRLRVTGDDTTCTATIIRADDPDFEFTVTRDVAWAKRMGLDGKDNYKKQPGTMLQWRAISGAARLACPEALYGVAYTPDEMADMPRVESAPVTAADITGGPDDTVDAEVVEDEPTTESEPRAHGITDAQRGRIFGAFKAAGIVTDARSAEGKAQRLDYIYNAIGRRVESTNDLSKREASVVIELLQKDAQDHNEAADGALWPEPQP